MLVVHGIGTQKRAAPLLDYVEPLVAWADQWSRARRGIGALVTSATLTDGEKPPRAAITVGLPDDGPVMRWVCSEARWSDAFPPPTPSQVLGWARRFTLRAATKAAIHLYRPVRTFIEFFLDQFWSPTKKVADDAADQRGTNPATAARPLVEVVIIAAVGLLALLYFTLCLIAYAIVLAVGVVVVTLATLLAGVLLSIAVKVPILRGRIATPVTGLVTSVGDAAVWTELPVRAAAMIDVVKDALDRLREEKPKKVVILAHSQGAAVTLAALARPSTTEPADPPVDVLVTVGAAVSLLGPTSTPFAMWSQVAKDATWINIWSVWDPVSSGPIADSRACARMSWRLAYEDFERVPNSERVDMWGDPLTPLPLAEPTVADPDAPKGLLSGVWHAAGLGLGEAYRQEAKVVAGGVFPAIPDDATPLDRNSPGPAEWPVHNLASLTGDHTAYRFNVPQVIAPLAQLLADLSGRSEQWKPPDDNVWRRALRAHVSRVRLLGAARISIAIAVVLSVLQVGPGQLITPAGAIFSAVNDKQGALFAALDTTLAGLLALALSGLVLFGIWAGLAKASWEAWERHACAALAQTATDPSARVRPHLAAAAFLMLHLAAVVTVCVLADDDFILVGGWDDVQGQVGLLLLGWIIVGPFLGIRPKPVPYRPLAAPGVGPPEPSPPQPESHGGGA